MLRAVASQAPLVDARHVMSCACVVLPNSSLSQAQPQQTASVCRHFQCPGISSPAGEAVSHVVQPQRLVSAALASFCDAARWAHRASVRVARPGPTGQVPAWQRICLHVNTSRCFSTTPSDVPSLKTQLRELYKRVHPDQFHNHPEAQVSSLETLPGNRSAACVS